MRLSCLSSLLFFVSCAVHTGQFSETQLSGPIEYRTVVVGQSQAYNVLGIGGSGRKTLLLEARKDMVRSHPLKAGESYANTTLDITTTNFWLFTKTTYTLAADVVASLDDSARRTFSKGYAAFMELPDSISSFPAPGDTVMTIGGETYLLVTTSSDGTAGVMDLSDQGLFHLVREPMIHLFAKHGEHLGFKVGDTLACEQPTDIGTGKVKEKDIIIGLGVREILVQRPMRKRKRSSIGGEWVKLLYGEFEPNPTKGPVKK